MGYFDDRYPKVDKTELEDGAKVDFGDGFFVTIRHISSRKVETVRAAKIQQMKVGARNKALTPEQSRELTHHVVANAGIVGWEGGDAPEFTPEKAIEIFKDRPEFLEDVLTAMNTYETFREELVDGAVGNSQTSSSGDSDTESS